MPTPVQWPPIGGATFQIPTSGETNWPVLTNFLVALSSAQGTAAQKVGTRVATTTPVTVSSTNDAVIGVDLAIAGPSVVNLPPGVTGQWICIVDRKSDAGTNNITINGNGAETVAGLPAITLNQDGASVILAFDGLGNWLIIAQAAGEGAGGGISRAAIDAATANWVVINGASGLLSQEQYLSAVRGGLGVNASAFNGFLKFTAGVPTAAVLAAADLPAAIDAAKIATGIISNTEFETLNNVTGNIQAQLDLKQPLDADLTALANIAGTGWAVRTNTDTWAMRTLTAASTKVSITNPGGIAGNPAFDVVEANLTLSNLGGTLSIAKGGTGANDAPGAINNLLPTQTGQAGKLLYTNGTLASWLATTSFVPLTTKGDLLGFASNNVRIPVGTDGQILTADSTNANGVAWKAAAAGGLTLSRKSSSFTAAAGFLYEVDTSGGAVTVTLPSYVAGGYFKIVDGARNFATNNLIITPATGEAIRGLAANASKTLSSNGDGIEMYADAVGPYWAYNQSGTPAATVPVTTKGDLFGFSTVGARVAVGTDGQILTADSTAATGVAWKASTASGEKNYLAASANSATGWAVSGAGMTVTTESTASNLPDSTTQTTGIKFLRASGADYAYARFTLDAVDYNKLLAVKPDSKYAGTAGDYTLRVFSNTASNYAGTSTELTVSPTTSIPSSTQQLPMSFMPSGSTAPYIEVRVYGVAGTTPLYMNNFIVGPGTVGQMTPVGDYSTSPVLPQGFGTPTSHFLNAHRSGSMLEIEAKFIAGTTTGVEARYYLPPNLTIATIGGNTGSYNKGQWWRAVIANPSIKQGSLILVPGLNYVTFGLDETSATGSPGNSQLGSGLCNSGDPITISVSIPIAEWTNTGVFLGPGAQVEYAYNTDVTSGTANTTAFGNGPIGAQFGPYAVGTTYTRDVQFPTPTQVGQEVYIEVSIDSGATWTTIEGTSAVVAYSEMNTVNAYGMYLTKVSSTVWRVSFAQGGRNLGATYGVNGSPFSALSGGVYRWRVVKANPASPVGFAKANSNEWGTVAPRKSQYPITVTSAQAGWATIRAIGIYYQDQDGNHRLKFSFTGTFTAVAVTSGTFTISGVTFKNLTNWFQAIAGGLLGSGAPNAPKTYADPNTSNVIFTCSSVTASGVFMSGDVELDSKPTWA